MEEDEEDENPGFVPPPRLEDARWRPVATWEVPAVKRDKAGAGAGAGAGVAALLSISPEGATALLRAGGGGLFALDLNAFGSSPRPLLSLPSSPSSASTPVIIGAAFSPTGECAAAVGSTGSVVVLPAAVEATATETTTKGKKKNTSSAPLVLGRAAARRLCWALTNNLNPLGPALYLSAADPEARRHALALLQRAVALHPWATRPALAPSASRAAAAVCRLARSRCSSAACADSPEASLEADLLTELRVGDLDAAVHAALLAGSSSSSSFSTESTKAPSSSSSRPLLPSLSASDAALLVPAVAWAEAVALWLLLSARHWATRRAEAEEMSKKATTGEGSGSDAATLAASAANHTPGVRLLASTAFLGALRQAVAAGLALPAEAAEEADGWLRGALCLSRPSPEGTKKEDGGDGDGDGEEAAASWLASWALSAPRASRLRALAASLAALTGRTAPLASEIDVAGATAGLVLDSAASLSSVPKSLRSSSSSTHPLAEPLAAPLSRAGGPLDPRRVLGVFGDDSVGGGNGGAEPSPGSAVSAWADSTPREWLLRKAERPPPRPPAPFLRAPLGVAVASPPSSKSSSSSSLVAAAASAARSTGAAPLPPLPLDPGAGALAPFGEGSSGATATAARRRRWASDRAGSAAAVAASFSSLKKMKAGAPSSPSAALGPLRQPQRQTLDALTWRPLDSGGGGGSQPALVSADGGSAVSASTVAAAAAAVAAAPGGGGGSDGGVSGVLLFGSWGAAAPPAGGGWFAA